jgi:hypothetical protein
MHNLFGLVTYNKNYYDSYNLIFKNVLINYLKKFMKKKKTKPPNELIAIELILKMLTA